MTVNLNGDMSQWTLGTSFAACASGQQAADCWRLHKAGVAVHTVRQSSDVPHWSICGRYIPYSLEIEVTTADASVGSTDVTALVYRGEGSEMAEMVGSHIRVRGWVKGPAGNYSLHVSNGLETMSYNQPIKIDDGDNWVPFDVWAPWQSPTYLTAYLNNQVGYSVALVLMAGSSFQDDMNEWITHSASAFKFAGISQSNFNATVGNKMKIAGLRVGDGPALYQPPEFVEQACMRYLEKSFDRATDPASNVGFGTGELVIKAITAGATNLAASQRFAVPKRKSGYTMTGYNPGAAGAEARANGAAANCTGTTFDHLKSGGFRVSATGPAGLTVNDYVGIHWLADASLPAITTSVGG